MNDEIIQLSDGSYSSVVVPVTKKDCSIRTCIDYRQWNAKIIPKSYSISRHENLFDDFCDAAVFTVLDLSSTYWGIPLREENIHKTASVLPKVKYEWLIMPFGSKDAAFSLAYVMDNILIEFKKAKSFCDDCILYSKRVKHLDFLQKVLQKFAKYCIYINYKKFKFMFTDYNFVSQPSRISDDVSFNRPNNLAERRTFLGMAAYCRKIIVDFSDRAACLHDLLEKG